MRTSLVVAAALIAMALVCGQAHGDGLKIETGAGLALVRDLDVTGVLGFKVGEVPEDWPLFPNEPCLLFVGFVGDKKVIGPAVGIGGDYRLGLPIWKENEKPAIDIAIWRSYPLTLRW